MRGQSHLCLGQYLAERYMRHIPDPSVKAFLFGCIQPDRNPVTYLKGSFRYQWLRGHNYRNARRFMKRISRRLERKCRWNLYDYYTLGKLIHYTADAFTYAHNADFPSHLRNHMEYEAALQEYFLSCMSKDPKVDVTMAQSIMDAMQQYHLEYEQQDASVHNDTRFALRACCCVLATLCAKPLL